MLQVKTAYRTLCLKHHPDLVPTEQRPEAEARFRNISDAYNRLYAGIVLGGRPAVCLQT